MELVNLPNLKSFTRKYGKNDYDNIIDALKLCNRIENVEITNSYAINSMQRIGELKDLKSLSMYSNQISKIEGLENKKSLHTLNLLGNKISKIEGIENLESLHTLNLTKNQIIDITPLEKNTSLMRLELKQNVGIDGNRNNYTEEQLKALDKIGEILDRNGRINIDIDKIGLFKNYKNLDLSGQKMDTLEPLEGLTQLEILSLKDNQLTLEDKKSQEILMKMTNLVNLNICNNKITNIKIINNLKNLKTLALKGNKIDLKEIEDIISNLESLEISTENLKTIINCDVNKITKLSIGYYSYINELPDLSKFNKLIELNLYNNSGIINFNLLSELSSLKTLNLKACNLHERMPDFSKLINLTNLDLSDNILWSNDLESLKSLKNNKNLTINLQNNSIVDARALLELDKSCKIYLQNNKNLTQESKDDLKERFGSNVIF
ncbi:MAG: leucine-rich repeat domain-containing protein [Clostridia bacterium]